MSETFLLYSVRMQAWLTASSTGTSSPTDAKQFTAFEAAEMGRKNLDHNRAPMLFPVPVAFFRSMGIDL